MRHTIDEELVTVSKAVTFNYAQRHLDSMLAERPAGVSAALLIRAAIQQLSARHAFEQSPESAALHLSGTARSLRRGKLLQM